MNISLQRRINDIIVRWDIWVSSATMLYYLTGSMYYSSSLDWPYDNSDFWRCMRLVENIPEVKKVFSRISKHNDRRKNVIDNWDKMCDLYKKQEKWEIDGKELYSMLR